MRARLRIPFTHLPPPPVTPAAAASLPAAVAALGAFFAAPPPPRLPPAAVVLSGAGLSVASGLADYRGPRGTYRVNAAYRPVYHGEFLASHRARQRYWARSFLGWPALRAAVPNAGHYALGHLADLGLVRSVITQNVDSLHPDAHPRLPSLELHGYLRATVCTACRREFPRDDFQAQLARLNPRWADLLTAALAAAALDSDDPARRALGGLGGLGGLRPNPDGDVDLPDAPYTTFRLLVCVDSDGAWALPSTAGVLKPAVVMFGENIASHVKTAADAAVDAAGKLLVLGTSLATYSAWRLVKRARDRGMPIAIVNIGGVRGEDQFFAGLEPHQAGEQGVRVELPTDQLLPALVAELRQEAAVAPNPVFADAAQRASASKDMPS